MVSFDAAFVAQSLSVEGGSTVDLAATSNISVDVNVTGNGSQLNLGADLTLSEDLDIYASSGIATVDAQGNDITARDISIGYAGLGYQGQILNPGQITATDDLFIRNTALNLDPAIYSVADRVYADDRAAVKLAAGFSAPSASVGGGSTMETTTSTNLSADVDVTDSGSLLTLGADLTLTEDLYVYGSSSTAATVDAGGHNITADQVVVGSIGRIGALTDVGMLTADNLTVQDESTLLLTGGDDVVLSSLTLDDGGILNIQQSIGELTGLSLEGDSLEIDTTSLMTLAFDSQLVSSLDWAFRWANPSGGGDRVATLMDYITGGLITWSAPWTVSVFDDADGYTYIGYVDAQVPVPAALGPTSLLLGSGWLAWRRRRVHQGLSGRREREKGPDSISAKKAQTIAQQ